MATELEEDFFKEYYSTEIDRMHKLDGNVTFPSAVIIVLGGWLAYYIQNAPSSGTGFLAIIFYLLLIVAVIAWITSIVFLIRSYVGHKYQLLSNPDAVAGFLQGMRNHYEDVHGQDHQAEVDADVDREFRTFLAQQYQDSSTHNRLLNLRRVSRLYWSHIAVIVTLALLFICVFPFLGLYEKKPQKVEIVNSGPPILQIQGTIQVQQVRPAP